jgi:hypothetical protein
MLYREHALSLSSDQPAPIVAGASQLVETDAAAKKKDASARG